MSLSSESSTNKHAKQFIMAAVNDAKITRRKRAHRTSRTSVYVSGRDVAPSLSEGSSFGRRQPTITEQPEGGRLSWHNAVNRATWAHKHIKANLGKCPLMCSLTDAQVSPIICSNKHTPSPFNP